MKTFIFSYLFSIIPLAYIFYPTFQVAPFDAVMRIGFYLGFPLAIVVSLVVVAVQHLAGFSGYENTARSVIHEAADGSAAGAELKAS